MGKVTLVLLCAFVFMVPFEGMMWFEDAPSASKILGAVVACSALVAFLTGHRLRVLPAPLVVCCLIVLEAVLSLTWSVDQEFTLTLLRRLLQLAVFAFLIWEFAVTYDDQLWVFRTFLLGMLVPLAMTFFAFHSASELDVEAGERFTGGGHNANYLAMMSSVAIMIAVYLATNPRPLDRLLRWFYWGFAAVTAMQIFLTGSRGGIVSLVICGFFAMITAGASRRRIIAVAQVLALVVVAFIFFRVAVSQELRDRLMFRGGGASVEDDPRVRIIKRGWAAYSRHELLGVGFGAFVPATAEPEDTHMQASHNTFLSYLVELGPLGITLYLVYLTLLVRAVWRLPKREKLMWLGIIAISLTLAVLGGSTIDKLTWFLYPMAIAQAAALGRPSGRRRRQRLPRGVALPVVAPLRPDLRKS